MAFNRWDNSEHRPTRSAFTDEQRKAFGARLKEMRLRRKMTQKQVSARIKVSVSYLCAIEKGLSNPPYAWRIRKISDEFNCDYDELLILSGRKDGEIRKLMETRPKLYELIEAAANSTDTQLDTAMSCLNVDKDSIRPSRQG